MENEKKGSETLIEGNSPSWMMGEKKSSKVEHPSVKDEDDRKVDEDITEGSIRFQRFNNKEV